MQRGLRNPQSDRQRSIWGGMCGQNEEHRQGVRSQDPKQVGDAEKSRNRLFPRGKGCLGVWRQEVDYQPALCLSRYYKFSKYSVLF